MKGEIRVRVRIGFWGFKVCSDSKLLITNNVFVYITIETLWWKVWLIKERCCSVALPDSAKS